MAFENINAAPNYFRQSFGQKGFRRITSSFTPVAGEEYRVIVPVEDAVVTVVSLAGDSLTSVTLPAGYSLYGLFSSVSVASGSVIAYIA